MTTSLSPRLLALIGLAVAAVAALFFVVRPLVLSGDDTAASATPTVRAAKPATSSISKPKTAPARAAKPKVVLLEGLPTPVAKRLRYHRVVVVSVFARPAQVDRQALVKARAGAKQAGAGFVALNAFDEASARAAGSLIGASAPPAVLIVRRPGKVVNRLQGSADSAIVAQAAHNAGAR
jgi:hypothetical protein